MRMYLSDSSENLRACTFKNASSVCFWILLNWRNQIERAMKVNEINTKKGVKYVQS